MPRLRQRWMVTATVTLSACAACQKPTLQRQAGTTKPAQAVEQVKSSATQTAQTQAQKAPPQQFGFNVVSVQQLLCCSDAPGKLTPIPHAVAVEGLTNDDMRFLLDCYGAFKTVKVKGGYRSEPFTKDDWYSLHVASIEHSQHRDEMTIYQWSFDDKGISRWDKMIECSVDSSLERARDVVPIRVVSSESHESQSGSGYEINAWTNQEIYKLVCVQGAQSPCVSIAPATYRAVRDGSEVRLCDQELNVIGTYTIESERGRP